MDVKFITYIDEFHFEIKIKYELFMLINFTGTQTNQKFKSLAKT